MAALKHPSPGSKELGAEEMYFSYGSNIHLQQMAARCRDSRLFGKGTLRNYKWQINSRGGANVIEGSREDFVEGIVFTVSPSDIRALRNYEGVKQQFYAETKLDIQVERLLDTTLEGRKPADAAEILALYNSKFRLTKSNSSADAATPEQNHTKSNSTVGDTFPQSSRGCSATSHQSRPNPRSKFPHEKPSMSNAEEPGSVHQNYQTSERKFLTGSPTSPHSSLEPESDSEQAGVQKQLSRPNVPSKNEATNPAGEEVFRKALIYISLEYPLPGDIREEYIARMQLAMADARMLGVSQNYLETSLQPLVFGKRSGARSDEIRSLLQNAAPGA